MAARAALITGGSSGIGLAIARALGGDGYSVTVSARRPEKLEAAAAGLREEGIDVEAVPANMVEEDEIRALATRHRERFGRLDALVNNAGVGIGAAVAETQTKLLDMQIGVNLRAVYRVGIGAAVAETQTKLLDMQIGVNLRAVYLMTRECVPMLKEAGAEHGKALVANTASIAGKRGQGWLAAYSATKFGVVGFTQALHRELAGDGVQATALCPAFVDTPMTDWVEGIPKEQMIQPEDIAEAIRFLLRTSPACIVPELQFLRRGESL